MHTLKKSHMAFMAAVLSGAILNPLNSSMIALALHSIQQDFHLTFATVSWLVSAFYLVSAVGQPVAGKVGDLIGRRKLFIGGLLLSAVACLFAPLASTFLVLLLMRLLQAIGNSTIYPSSVALVHQSVNKERQGSTLAALAICASVMTACGPSVGGLLIVWGGWPSIFYVNFPFIVVSLALGLIIFPKDINNRSHRLKSLLKHLDIPGIILFSISIVSLLWFLLTIKERVNIWAAAAGLLSGGLFVWRECKTRAPFVNLHLLKINHRLTLVYLLFILLNVANYCLFYGMPTFFQSGMHLGIRLSGVMMLSMSLASVIASLITGHRIDHSGPTVPLKLGAFLTAIGSLLLMIVAFERSLLLIGLFLLLIGCGYGIGNVALQTMMLRESPEEMVGTSAGLFQTCRFIGSISASAVLGVIFATTITSTDFLILTWVLAAVSVPALFISVTFFQANRAD
ncbi:MFS transporter [Sporolactobacillus sp. STSJ-5]|uniref:MFS transporter n=1 Tax=Sporolactobacillus sp. STSJ-5 TaxID=2965076 RepID=UPI0021037AE0|nr:MFS transporter [Sporolactobacillus sp. STSJ-5]MCQ2010177.1 MFS transporter [Sporolactobacillus sp. STSJ-5]